MYTAICICTYIHIYAWMHSTQLHALFFMLGRCHQQCFHITTLVTLSNVFNTAGRTNTAPTLSQQHETRICHGCVLRSSGCLIRISRVPTTSWVVLGVY